MEPARLPRCLTPLMYGNAEVIRIRVMQGAYRAPGAIFPNLRLDDGSASIWCYGSVYVGRACPRSKPAPMAAESMHLARPAGPAAGSSPSRVRAAAPHEPNFSRPNSLLIVGIGASA